MTQSLQQQISAVKTIENPQDLWHITRDFFLDRGAKMLSYRHFFGKAEPEEMPMLITHGVPDRILDTLLNEHMQLVNPVPDLASRTTDPFFWSDIAGMTRLLDSESAFLNDLILPQLGDGLSIQVFGPLNRNGLLNVGFGGGRPDLDARAIKEMQLSAQLSHLAYIRLTPELQQSPHGMTAREVEVLDWIAKGKSNSVIADILGISAHTVDTHVRRIFRKLDVNDRTTAAVKGLGAGLVQVAA